MTTPTNRGGLLPELWDWLESPLAALRTGAGNAMRIEDGVEDGRYIVRAELPGVDPDRDIDVTVDNGVLTIRAERREEQQGTRRSEFRYGALMRSLTLPAGVDEKDVRAGYDKGVLEVGFAMPETRAGRARRVPIEAAG
jgi:HSP20 family molecular chaperone IbpA